MPMNEVSSDFSRESHEFQRRFSVGGEVNVDVSRA